jgi:hypothetical protein
MIADLASHQPGASAIVWTQWHQQVSLSPAICLRIKGQSATTRLAKCAEETSIFRGCAHLLSLIVQGSADCQEMLKQCVAKGYIERLIDALLQGDGMLSMDALSILTAANGSTRSDFLAKMKAPTALAAVIKAFASAPSEAAHRSAGNLLQRIIGTTDRGSADTLMLTEFHNVACKQLDLQDDAADGVFSSPTPESALFELLRAIWTKDPAFCGKFDRVQKLVRS